MSYSIRKENIDRLGDFLDILVDSQADQVAFECHDSTRFAYKLRQAFFAARHHAAYSMYHNLQDDYQVLAKVGHVVCKRVQKDGEHFRVEAATVGTLQLSEITTLTGVFGAAIRFKNVEELWFPSVTLIPETKLRVYEWTAERDWQFIDHHGEGLTLTKKEVDKDLPWTPEDG